MLHLIVSLETEKTEKYVFIWETLTFLYTCCGTTIWCCDMILLHKYFLEIAIWCIKIFDAIAIICTYCYEIHSSGTLESKRPSFVLKTPAPTLYKSLRSFRRILKSCGLLKYSLLQYPVLYLDSKAEVFATMQWHPILALMQLLMTNLQRSPSSIFQIYIMAYLFHLYSREESISLLSLSN